MLNLLALNVLDRPLEALASGESKLDQRMCCDLAVVRGLSSRRVAGVGARGREVIARLTWR